MKLLQRDESGVIFLLAKRERELMISLLRRYPVMIAAHFRARHPARTAEARKNQELLEEALAEQQTENRRNLEQMLSDAGRFAEDELGFTFRLTFSETEWLLQVLNDIRVGSWIQLGEPDAKEKAAPAATEENVQLAWAMEMAGFFEHSLLEAVNFAAE
jgi:hypothetical protein